MFELEEFSTNVRKCFAERLKELREKNNLTQGQLAEKLGVSRGSISYYENMDRVPDIEFLVRAKKFFDVPTDYLIGITDNSMPEYQDIGLLLGLSDEAIDNIMEMDYICGENVFNFLVESESFLSLAEILATYISGSWGYRVPYEIEKKVIDDVHDVDCQGKRNMMRKYMRDSGYTEYLMTHAMIEVLKDVRQKYDNTLREWTNELSVTEKDIFNALLADVETLAKQYVEVKNSPHGIHSRSIDEAYKKLTERWDELEAFKLKHGKIADIKKRLSKIEIAIKKRDEHYKKEGVTDGERDKEDK